jgi:hypothetical protein
MPTLLQKRASKLVDKGGNYKEIMTKAGYSLNTAKTPQKLTESKGWQILIEKQLPDSKLARVHKSVLKATKWFVSPTEADKEVPDYPTRLKAVELGYKLKHKIGPEIMQQFNTGGEMTIQFTGDDQEEHK